MLDFHKQIKRRYGELLALGGIMLAMMGIELLISFLFATFEDGNNTLVFSGVIVIAFTFFFHIFINCFGFIPEFNIAVSMGETRKRFVWSYYCFSIIEMLLIIGLGFMIGKIEKIIISLCYPQQECIELFWNHINIFMIVVMIVIFSGVELLVSAFLLRFDRKAFWILWCIWMIGCLGPAYITKHDEIAEKILGVLEHVLAAKSLYVTLSVVLLLGIMAIGIAWRLLKKQQVTNI